MTLMASAQGPALKDLAPKGLLLGAAVNARIPNGGDAAGARS